MPEPAENEQPQNPQTPPAPAPANGGDSPQVDPKWLNERLERAKNAAVNELLKTLGFEKSDDLKSLVDKAKQDEVAKLSEVEKANKARETEKARADAAEKLAADLKVARLKDKAEEVLKSAAREAKASDVEDVLMWAEKNAPEDLAKLVNDEGKPDKVAVDALIKKAQTAKPTWFTTASPGSPSNRGGKTAVGDADALKKLGGKRLVRF